MAHMVRRDPSYKRGLPKPKESPAYLTDFKNYDSTLQDTQNLTPEQEAATIGYLDDRNKADLRKTTDALIADFLLSGGTITKWPKEHRILPRWTTVSVPGANETKPTRT